MEQDNVGRKAVKETLLVVTYTIPHPQQSANISREKYKKKPNLVHDMLTSIYVSGS